MSDIEERSHAEIWDKIEALQTSTLLTTSRLGVVERNQDDFKAKFMKIEKGQEETAIALAAHRAEFKAGVGLLAFLIVTGISLLGVYS